MVKVCNAIMGSGKTSATISYINAHPEKRFLYITPYLPEAKRIKDGCPDAKFVEPSDQIPEYRLSKSVHSLALIDEGRNITSTHQAMMYYTPETFKKLKEMDYSIIIDEEVNILQEAPEVSYSDVKIAESAGYIYKSAPNEFSLTGLKYDGGRFTHMFRLMASRPLIYVGDNASYRKKLWYWIFSTEMFRQLDDITVLTYLFEGSEMQAFMKINNIKYKYIGIGRTEDGGYEFSDDLSYVPAYTKHLGDMIHIEDSEKLNGIGDSRNALSKSWYEKNPAQVEQLKKNIYNFFRNRVKCTVKDRMCGTFKDHWGKIRDKGYWKSNVVFTKRSSNEFRERNVLVYPVNIFAGGNVVSYYAQRGERFDNDRYALSIMVQWIWRSAIRDGKEIWVYIPSKRMRDLLINWIEEVSRS